MPNHSERADHLSTISQPLTSCTNGEDKSTEKEEYTSNIGFSAQPACSSPFRGAFQERSSERMVRDLYRYQLGTITFLDLLALWEEQLEISPSSIQSNREKECMTTSKAPCCSAAELERPAG